MDFTKEVVTNHLVRAGRELQAYLGPGVVGPPSQCSNQGVRGADSAPLSLQGYITVGADLHFSKGLREVIEKYRPAQPSTPSPVA